MIRCFALAAVLSLVVGVVGAGAAVDLPSAKPEDCAVMAALGRARLHWDTQAPGASMRAIFYRPEGGRLVEQCPWRSLGVTPPTPAAPDPHDMIFFTQPTYGAGGKSASVEVVTQMIAVGPDGKEQNPFMSEETCALSKHGRAWRLDGCHQAVVT